VRRYHLSDHPKGILTVQAILSLPIDAQKRVPAKIAPRERPEEAGVPPAGEDSPRLAVDQDAVKDEAEDNPNLGVQVDTNDPVSIWRTYTGIAPDDDLAA
jgi:hypothetical protein